eukprot:m.13414 g.13414  ORF g.13414 m.13414 type:complete len:67 (+) comp24780_c0_seq1:624-824(+)
MISVVAAVMAGDPVAEEEVENMGLEEEEEEGVAVVGAGVAVARSKLQLKILMHNLMLTRKKWKPNN